MLWYVNHIVSTVRDAETALSRHVYEQQRLLTQRIPSFLRQGSLRNLLTTPIIYSLVLPFVLLDVWIAAYQWICFPVYGIPRVPRHRYLVIDRQRLPYLNAIERANCVYCGYANGLLAYVREVAARTEQYWCPIRHARRIPSPHGHYRHFVEYGDAAGYRRGLPRIRTALSRRRSSGRPTSRVRR